MLDYSTLPNPRMKGALKLYFDKGIEPGSFLSAVLCNDLREACSRADTNNQRCIFETVRWLYSEAPSNSWGGYGQFSQWVAFGGMDKSAHSDAQVEAQA